MAEEDAELKELVIQSLENNGVLAKIRAQLRASVFLALDEAKVLEKKKPLANEKLQSYLATRNGQVMAKLVRDFLQYFNLDSTLSVYESESSYGLLYPEGDRPSLCRDLGLDPSDVSKGPIIDAIAGKHLVQSYIGDSPEDVTRFTLTASTPVTENNKSAKPNSFNVATQPETLHSLEGEGEGEEGDHDPFFDDPVPNKEHARNGRSRDIEPFGIHNWGSGEDQAEAQSVAMEEKRQLPSSQEMTGQHEATFTVSPLLGSLKDAPPLASAKGSGKLPPLWSDKPATFKSANIHDDDYEEDFQSSASVRSDVKSGTDHSIEEDIEEENFSGAVDDLLSNEGTEGDDVTTDHTISNISGAGADYLESVG